MKFVVFFNPGGGSGGGTQGGAYSGGNVNMGNGAKGGYVNPATVVNSTINGASGRPQ